MAKSSNGDQVQKDMAKFARNLEKRLGTRFYNKVGRQLVALMKERIKAGYGCSKMGGAKKKFKKLAPSTIKYRERLSKPRPKPKRGRRRNRRPTISNETTPSTSNQILTGTMVNGINFTVKKNSLEIGPPRSRSDVAEWQEENGRPSMYLTKEEMQVYEDAVNEILDQEIDKFFK